MNEVKHQRFLRLAKLRGDRVLSGIRLIGNLSNRNNYEYTDEEIKHVFSSIEEELKVTKSRFIKNTKKVINL